MQDSGPTCTYAFVQLGAQRVETVADLGTIVRQARKRQGYTQTTLANYAGVGINFVSNLENGKATTELDKALRVLQTLGLDTFVQERPQ